jgi:hypothetical protein
VTGRVAGIVLLWHHGLSSMHEVSFLWPARKVGHSLFYSTLLEVFHPIWHCAWFGQASTQTNLRVCSESPLPAGERAFGTDSKLFCSSLSRFGIFSFPADLPPFQSRRSGAPQGRARCLESNLVLVAEVFPATRQTAKPCCKAWPRRYLIGFPVLST